MPDLEAWFDENVADHDGKECSLNKAPVKTPCPVWEFLLGCRGRTWDSLYRLNPQAHNVTRSAPVTAFL